MVFVLKKKKKKGERKREKVLMANRFLLLPAGSSLYVVVHVSVTKARGAS